MSKAASLSSVVAKKGGRRHRQTQKGGYLQVAMRGRKSTFRRQ
jgi:hypothetical protein